MSLSRGLGVRRWRILRQLMVDSFLIALIAGALGILVAFWGIDLLKAANPGEAANYAPGWGRIGINFPVLAFTLALSLLSGLVFGLAPAWQFSKPDLNSA